MYVNKRQKRIFYFFLLNLINDRNFDFYSKKGIILKLTINIYSFNKFKKYKKLITEFTFVNTLRNKKNICF